MYEDMIDHCSYLYAHNLSSCEIKVPKNSGLNKPTGSWPHCEFVIYMYIFVTLEGEEDRQIYMYGALFSGKSTVSDQFCFAWVKDINLQKSKKLPTGTNPWLLFSCLKFASYQV